MLVTHKMASFTIWLFNKFTSATKVDYWSLLCITLVFSVLDPYRRSYIPGTVLQNGGTNLQIPCSQYIIYYPSKVFHMVDIYLVGKSYWWSYKVVNVFEIFRDTSSSTTKTLRVNNSFERVTRKKRRIVKKENIFFSSRYQKKQRVDCREKCISLEWKKWRFKALFWHSFCSWQWYVPLEI